MIGALISWASPRHSSSLLRSFSTAVLAAPNRTIHCTLKSLVANATPAATTPCRSLSSMGGMPRRGFPQYTVFGVESALSLRAIMPFFKRAGSDGVSVDRRGKLVLEFIPRNATGAGFAWADKTLFSLTVEEMGLLLSQLPGNDVELTHQVHHSGAPGRAVEELPPSGATQLSGDVVEKVLTIDPGEGATLKFKVDFMSGGVGGQNPPGMEGVPVTPLEITIQAGEFEVIRSIFQTSIPYLLGWNTTMDIASAAAMSRGINGGGSQMMY